VYKPTIAPTPAPLVKPNPAPVVAPAPVPIVAPAPTPTPVVTPVVKPAPIFSSIVQTVPPPQVTQINQISPSAHVIGNNKFALIGLVSLIISLVISYFPLIKLLAGNFLQAGLILSAIYLIPVLTLQLLTRKVLDHSWGKCLMVIGVPSLVASVLNFIVNSAGLPSIVGGAVSLGIIIGWVFLFSKIYKTGLGRAFKIGLFQVLINAIIIIVLILVLGSGFLTSISTNINN
jgi:hypothetical protein